MYDLTAVQTILNSLVNNESFRLVVLLDLDGKTLAKAQMIELLTESTQHITPLLTQMHNAAAEVFATLTLEKLVTMIHLHTPQYNGFIKPILQIYTLFVITNASIEPSSVHSLLSQVEQQLNRIL